MSVNPAGRVLADGPDTRLFIWTLAWDTHAFTHQPLSIFDANIYYPERHTLAYSENLIGSGFVSAPVIWLTGNPVLAMNVVALLSCVLCGLGAYVLGRRLGLGPPAALLTGIIFAFSPPRFFRLSQLHLTTIQWLPFGLASLHAYFDAGRKSDMRLALAFFTLQALTSGHGAVFLLLAMTGLTVYRLASGEPLALATRLKDAGVPGALLLAPTLLILIPYRRVQVEMGLSRSPDDWISNWSSFLASPSHLHTFLLSLAPDARINETAQAFLFPGYLPLILAAAAFLWMGSTRGRVADAPRTSGWGVARVVLDLAGLLSFVAGLYVSMGGAVRLRIGSAVLLSIRDAWRPWVACGLFVVLRLAIAGYRPSDVPWRYRDRLSAFATRWMPRCSDARTFYGLLTILSMWLSAGPLAGLWPLVYWLPGLSFIRVPSRFSLLALLGVAVLAGIGFDRLSAALTPRRRALLAGCAGGVLILEFAALPLSTTPYAVQIPPVDRWLAGQPKPFVVAELPLGNPRNLGGWERRHTEYMLHSMAHWQKTVEGYSGLRPALHEALYARLLTFPDQDSLRSLTEIGVDYVVVHTDLYSPEERPRLDARLAMFQPWLTLQREDGAGRVYRLRAP
ncbi:MAG: hypothetical protein ABJA98_16580 [Acidobacteriota bacterium]